ncbi:linoleate 13S-lipoxygenase 3-1, chloroplastic-like protein [Tanacetum coccineum]
MRVLQFHLIFTFPREFRATFRIPPNLDDGNPTTLQLLKLSFQNFHRLFHKIQLSINSNLIQRHLQCWISQTLLKVRHVECVMNTIQVFLWIDALVFPLSTSWFSSTSVDKDPLPVDEAVDLPCMELLNENRTLIRKYPETFLCFVGLSRSFTKTETDSKKYMEVVDTLSTHSPDEDYIGERQQQDTWFGDAEMVEAFYGFASEIQRIEKEIEKRNCNMSLKNRCGASVFPYELLAPSSEPGVTCCGIPCSVSI